MSKKDKIPDLRLLIVGTLETIRFVHPEYVTEEHVERVRSATNVLLVSIRVAISICKGAGLLTSEDVASIVEAANNPVRDVSAESAMSREPTIKVTGRYDDHQVLKLIDDAMMDPKSRAEMPDWFVDSVWPSMLKRIAAGGSMRPREREISLYVVSTARGER